MAKLENSKILEFNHLEMGKCYKPRVYILYFILFF